MRLERRKEPTCSFVSVIMPGASQRQAANQSQTPELLFQNVLMREIYFGDGTPKRK